jgi:hypothetical protein
MKLKFIEFPVFELLYRDDSATWRLSLASADWAVSTTPSEIQAMKLWIDTRKNTDWILLKCLTLSRAYLYNGIVFLVLCLLGTWLQSVLLSGYPEYFCWFPWSECRNCTIVKYITAAYFEIYAYPPLYSTPYQSCQNIILKLPDNLCIASAFSFLAMMYTVLFSPKSGKTGWFVSRTLAILFQGNWFPYPPDSRFGGLQNWCVRGG